MPGIGGYVKTTEVNLFEKIQVQMQALHDEVGVLSKKSPNDALNKFKLKLVNGLIHEANSLLTDDYKPLAGFEVFNEDDIPTNSDVVMVLAQYLNCLEKLRSDNIEESDDDYGWYWVINNKLSDIKTKPPRKLQEK
jgi:hypothetical protein